MNTTHLTASPVLYPFDSPLADLVSAGGKGANLARLSRAGFPVPPGFIIPSAAYTSFTLTNRLDDFILARLEGMNPADSARLECVSREIRERFATGVIPPDLHAAILDAYAGLGAGPVAVRSSATAEDLPELSFAGQQDTFLNVLGGDSVLSAVVQCWSSLWTARAIGYRLRNQVDSSGLALAVIVQRMVESQVSGVVFTANPLSGLRSEAVIDAAFGLGEALVSGQVEPDHYVVDLLANRIRSKTLGGKAISIHGQSQGGTHVHREDRSNVQALTDEQILELARISAQVAREYGAPQDIEWAWTADGLFLLQSRPITSLYPLPDSLNPEPLKVLFSFGAVQGMLDPITPAGRSVMQKFVAAGASLFGIKANAQTQTALYVAGERLWGNFTPIVSNTVGRRVIRTLGPFLEPTIGQALEDIREEPSLQPQREGISLTWRFRFALFLVPMAANIFLNLAFPRRRRESIIGRGERILAILRARAAAVEGTPHEKLAQRAGLIDFIIQNHLGKMFPLFVSGVAAGMAAWNLSRLLRPEGVEKDQWNRLVLDISRGMPHNPTTTMDLELWKIARQLQGDPASVEALDKFTSADLADRYRAASLPPALQSGISRFLETYGGRGLAEIDLGRPRWNEEPEHVFEMLSSFVHIQDPEAAPDAVFKRGANAAEAAVGELIRLARAGKHGWLRARQLRFTTGRARQWMGVRESPKFFVVRMFAIIRTELLRSGVELASMGEIDQPDDLFFLTLDEMQAFSAGKPGDWRGLVQSRRLARVLELRRRQIPRLLLSDGRTFYSGMRASSPSAIAGSPVSPGSVRGRVRVVFNPSQANLQPGEILVCPGTDPSWTPLFLSAGGLVMEVGGMMTHGAVVAREYGIPAVVGVHEATTRLKTGMEIIMDGSSGMIEVLDSANPG